MKICSKCTVENSEDAVFCRNCGSLIEQPDEKPKPKRKVLIIITVFLILVLNLFLILKIYTWYGEELTVPDLRGLTLSQAEWEAKRNHMKVEIFDSSVYHSDFEMGTIVEHHPKNGIKVKRNSTIYLTINPM